MATEMIHCKKDGFGDFYYDPNEFQVNIRNGSIYYIGKETDGKKIVIPEGLQNCSGMFWGCTLLKTSPIIPEGVINCDSMFEGCTSLIETPIIPKSVISCSFMLAFCTSLTKEPIIPEGVTHCSKICQGCVSMLKGPIIPDSAVPPKEFDYDSFIFGYDSKEVQLILEDLGLSSKKMNHYKHYKEELGEFNYNPEEFKICKIRGSFEYLKYIGKETDGSKIHIPEGITDVSFMFFDTVLTTPVEIPKTVIHEQNFLYNNRSEFLNK